MQVSGLQTLSSFSLLKSPILVDELVKDAVDKGYSSLALTDINVTYGLVDFYLAAKKANLNPLLGMTIRLNGMIDQAHRYDLISIAKNNEGYKNLLRLSSAINLKTDNGDERKVLTLKQVAKYLSDQIFIIPANVTSELRYLSENNEKLGSDYLRELQKIIPSSSDLYLGVYASKNQPYINYVKALAAQFNLPLAAAEDVQYLQASDQFLVKTLRAIEQGQKLVDTSSLALQKGSHYLRSSGELVAAYNENGIIEALHNAAKIADECKAEVIFTQPELPRYRQNFGQKHPLMVWILTLLFNLLILVGIYLSYLSFQEEHDTKVAYAEIELALKKQNINTHEIKVAKPFVRNQRAFTNTIWYTLAFTFKGQKYEATY